MVGDGRRYGCSSRCRRFFGVGEEEILVFGEGQPIADLCVGSRVSGEAPIACVVVGGYPLCATVGTICVLSCACGAYVLVGVEAVDVGGLGVGEAEALVAVNFWGADGAVLAACVIGGVVVCLEGAGAVGATADFVVGVAA